MRIFGWFRRSMRQDPMDCARVGEVLQSYLDGELDDDTAPLVAEHLEMCRRCGLEASVYTDVRDALANRVAPPEESVDRLRDFGVRIAHGDIPFDEGPAGDGPTGNGWN